MCVCLSVGMFLVVVICLFVVVFVVVCVFFFFFGGGGPTGHYGKSSGYYRPIPARLCVLIRSIYVTVVHCTFSLILSSPHLIMVGGGAGSS